MRYYTKDGKKYKSVTSIISEMYPFNEDAQRRYEDKVGRYGLTVEHVSSLSKAMGTKVSEWLDNACKGTTEFDPPAIGEKEEGLRKAVDAFIQDYELVETEKTVYCDEYGFAGTLDMIFRERAEPGVLMGCYLGDAKTFGAWERTPYKRSVDKLKKAGIQTDMYAYAYGDYDMPRAIVIFKVDGTYVIEPRKRHDKQWIKFLEEKNEDVD